MFLGASAPSLYAACRLDEAKLEGQRMSEWNPEFSVEGFLAHSANFQSAYGHNTHAGPALKAVFGP